MVEQWSNLVSPAIICPYPAFWMPSDYLHISSGTIFCGDHQKRGWALACQFCQKVLKYRLFSHGIRLCNIWFIFEALIWFIHQRRVWVGSVCIACQRLTSCVHACFKVMPRGLKTGICMPNLTSYSTGALCVWNSLSALFIRGLNSGVGHVAKYTMAMGHSDWLEMICGIFCYRDRFKSSTLQLTDALLVQ